MAKRSAKGLKGNQIAVLDSRRLSRLIWCVLREVIAPVILIVFGWHAVVA
jgi:hypothetical protein